MKYALLFISFIFSNHLLLAQITIVTGSTLQEGRYKEYRETPYFFDDQAEATFFTPDEKSLTVKKLRYNGLLEQFEVAKPSGEFVAIESSSYPRVEVYTSNDTLHFSIGTRPGHPKKYMEILYTNTTQILYKAWIMAEGKITVQNVGRTETHLSFMKKPLYFFADKNGATELISLKRKPFSKFFKHKASAVEKAYKSAPKGSSIETRAVYALEKILN